MRGLIHTVLFILCVHLSTFAQKETNIWYYGNKCGLDFSTSPPTVLSNNILNSFEGSSSISDASGNLLFYTDGQTIVSKQHTVMANGSGLMGHHSTTQAAMIVKQPGNSSIYYVFTLDAQGQPNGLQYSIVDMSLAAGMGSVTVKNVPLLTPCTEQLSAVRHCNGIDVWIMSHEFNSDKFVAFLLSSSGVSAPVISPIGPLHGGTAQGTLKFSPQGNKLGEVRFNANPGVVAIYDFDNITGVVSNSLLLASSIGNTYGCEFSPDGTKFYCGAYTTGTIFTTGIYQWDLCAGTNSAIVNSQVAVGTPTHSPGQLQTGPDGKIYVRLWSQPSMGCINFPNIAGAACNYVNGALAITSGTPGTGLPNFVNSYFKPLPSAFTHTNNGCMTFSFTASSFPSPSCPAAAPGYTSYTWSFGDPSTGSADTSTLLNPVHQFSSMGTYTVKLWYNSSSCSADTLYQEIGVGAFSSITSATASCNGLGSANVNLQGGGSYTYLWVPSGHTTANATNLSPGIHTVVISSNMPGGCSSSHTVNVNPIMVTGTPATTISCSGSTAEIVMSNGSGSYNYQWLPGFQNTQTISGPLNGMYTVTVNDLLNGCSISRTLHINPLPSPTITLSGNFSICSGQTTSISANGAANYTWSTGSGNSFISVSPTVTTSYTVSGNQPSLTCQGSKVFSISVSKCAGLNDRTTELDLKIFPNPNSGVFMIETSGHLDFIIINSIGAKVMEVNLSPGKQTIDLSRYGAGVYFGKYSEKNLNKVVKITVTE